MLNITMQKARNANQTPRPRTSSRKTSRKEEEIAAAELALKAYVLRSDPEILADMTDGDGIMQEIENMIDLTEAPEDVVASLVIDLLQYCEREKIDWTQDVMSRARGHLRSERPDELQKR